jgi:hypothetical protein
MTLKWVFLPIYIFEFSWCNRRAAETRLRKSEEQNAALAAAVNAKKSEYATTFANPKLIAGPGRRGSFRDGLL